MKPARKGSNKHFVAILFHGILPVFVGGIIYITWRSSSLLMFHWFEAMNLIDIINIMRSNAFSVPKWFIYSLPSGLWIYSFTFILTYVWYDSKSNLKYFWIALAPIVAIGSEIGQLFGIVPGTYDFTDILLYVAFIILSFVAAAKYKGLKKGGLTI